MLKGPLVSHTFLFIQMREVWLLYLIWSTTVKIVSVIKHTSGTQPTVKELDFASP